MIHTSVCEEMPQKIAKKKKRHYMKQLWIIRKNILGESSKTTKDVDYMHLGICKEVARQCKEEEKTYHTIVKYCMKRGYNGRT